MHESLCRIYNNGKVNLSLKGIKKKDEGCFVQGPLDIVPLLQKIESKVLLMYTLY